jgi:hypothetical protein
MRKVLRRGAIFATGIVVIFSLAGFYASCYPNSTIGQLAQVTVHIGKHYVLRLPDAAEQAAHDDGYSADDETLAAPEDPQPVTQEPNAIPGEVASNTVTPPSSGASEPAGKSAIGAPMGDQYRVMPRCQDETEDLPTFMPYAAERAEPIQKSVSLKPAAGRMLILETEPAKGPEEQLPDAKKFQEIIEGHAKELFSPGARERGRKLVPRLDTLEFRPSDAGPERFDPLEF